MSREMVTPHRQHSRQFPLESTPLVLEANVLQRFGKAPRAFFLIDYAHRAWLPLAPLELDLRFLNKPAVFGPDQFRPLLNLGLSPIPPVVHAWPPL